MISEGSCDTEDQVMMLKIQLTFLNDIQIENNSI